VLQWTRAIVQQPTTRRDKLSHEYVVDTAVVIVASFQCLLELGGSRNLQSCYVCPPNPPRGIGATLNAVNAVGQLPTTTQIGAWLPMGLFK
jgi:hypothetical protein